MKYTREQVVNSKVLTTKEKNAVLDYLDYDRIQELRYNTIITVIETHITNLYIY